MPTKCLKMEYVMMMAQWEDDLVGVSNMLENG